MKEARVRELIGGELRVVGDIAVFDCPECKHCTASAAFFTNRRCLNCGKLFRRVDSIYYEEVK